MAKPVLSDLDFNNVAKLLNVPAPTANGDAANKAYVDAVIAGLAWKDTARVLPPANVNIASPGATLDGVAMSANDRVLLINQTTQTENGVYVFNSAASAMTRASDFDSTAEIEGAVVPVEEGASAGSRWVLTTQNPIVGTSNLVFANTAAGAPNATPTIAGLVELANQAEVDAGASSPANLAVTPVTLNGWSGRPLKFTATIGDGTATQIDVTHNLNSLNVQPMVRRISDGKILEVEATAFSVNITRFNFASAPALNSLQVMVDG
jgi:hypothetical protein